MKRTLQKGFTVVEILVVIVIIAVLVMVTATIYQSVQIQVRDAKNADGANKIADALELWIAKNGKFPNGGNGSTAGIDGTGNCPNGANGWFSNAYSCTVQDVLINAGYLPADYAASLSPNVVYSPTLTTGTRTIMLYKISGVDKAMLSYSLEQPSASDTANYNAELTKCYGSVPGVYAPRDTYKMANGICVQFKTF